MKLGVIDEYIDFLGQPWHARFSVIAANIWRGVPFVASRCSPDCRPFRLRITRRRASTARRRGNSSVRDASAADTDHRRRDDLLGADDVHRFSADLRDHARGSAQCDAPDGDAVVPACDLGGSLGEGAAIATAMVPFLLAVILLSYFGLQRRAWQQGGADK
jgi:multiple sugar transport system permease protein